MKVLRYTVIITLALLINVSTAYVAYGVGTHVTIEHNVTLRHVCRVGQSAIGKCWEHGH